MSTSESFVEEVVPLLRAEVEAMHHGDSGPRLALWSRNEPVTLFGAWLTARGSTEVETVFARLAGSFHGSGGSDLEVVAAECSGELGYVVALEHSTGVVTDEGPRDYTLRVTTVLRREDGAWKVVHRHGDNLDVVSPTQ